MSYEVLLVDWDNKKMFISTRWKSNNDRNKFIYKAWFIDGTLERRSSLYDGETDEEYYERLVSLKKMPLYIDYKDELIKYLQLNDT